jgi:hypothetical protein
MLNIRIVLNAVAADVVNIVRPFPPTNPNASEEVSHKKTNVIVRIPVM